MAIENKFTNTIADQKEEKKKVKKLSVLKEDDENTIFNLILVDKSNKEIDE